MESGPGINGTLKEIPRGGSDSPPFGFLTSLSSTAAGLSLRPTQKGSKMVPPAAPALASALLKTGVRLMWKGCLPNYVYSRQTCGKFLIKSIDFSSGAEAHEWVLRVSLPTGRALQPGSGQRPSAVVCGPGHPRGAMQITGLAGGGRFVPAEEGAAGQTAVGSATGRQVP